jgi:fatty acid desaturase
MDRASASAASKDNVARFQISSLGRAAWLPYRHWRWQHALHHGTAGDLDRRGSGDIWTLTVFHHIHHLSPRFPTIICSDAMTPILFSARSSR